MSTANEIRVRNTIISMLNVRNYKTPEGETELDAFMKADEHLTHKLDDETDRIYIFFPKKNKVGVIAIREYIEEMNENNVKRAIIVVKESITAFAMKQVNNDKLIIEHFTESELLIDKLKHVYVPKHELLAPEDKSLVLDTYKCKEAQLPKVLASDPISRYFGARRGEVFKITRVSPTSGEYVYYRIVV